MAGLASRSSLAIPGGSQKDKEKNKRNTSLPADIYHPIILKLINSNYSGHVKLAQKKLFIIDLIVKPEPFNTSSVSTQPS